MFSSTNKKVTCVWNSEVGSRKSMEKAEDIQFHPWNTTYIFTAVKIQPFIFSRLWNTAFLKYALYLFNIFLYFITLYIIKIYITIHKSEYVDSSCSSYYSEYSSSVDYISLAIIIIIIIMIILLESPSTKFFIQVVQHAHICSWLC